LAEKALNSRLKIQAGIGLNVMETRYSQSGPAPITSSGGEKNLINRLDLPGPPYTIIDHYSSSSKRNGKFWIGLQVGLLYDLIFFHRP
jgi:hypothetical protein